jgi:hypothetical protein
VFTFAQRHTQARERRRLARAVRDYAEAERQQYHRAGVLELESVAARAALYERIVALLESGESPVAEAAVRRLESLIAATPPMRDYGPRAEERNSQIASILADLDAR